MCFAPVQGLCAYDTHKHPVSVAYSPSPISVFAMMWETGHVAISPTAAIDNKASAEVTPTTSATVTAVPATNADTMV